MTLDSKNGLNDPEQEATSAPRVVYEAPVLVPLGNVHALLAGTGMSIVKDTNKVGPMS